MEIITPKSLLLIDSGAKIVSDDILIGVLRSVQIGNTKLTCCCEYKGWIVCAGFSGQLFFVKDMTVERIENISNSIIRCVTEFNDMLLITTDSGQIILFDGEKIVFLVNTDSPVYSVLVIDKSTFLSGERSGTIKEWYYVDGKMVFNRIKATVDGCIFALALINGEVIAVGSKGKNIVSIKRIEYLKTKSHNAIFSAFWKEKKQKYTTAFRMARLFVKKTKDKKNY